MLQPPLCFNAENPSHALVPLQVDTAGNLLTHQNPNSATLVSATLSATGAVGTPPANSNIRRLQVIVSGAATLATAGAETIAVELNGVTIFESNVYIGAAAVSGAIAVFDVPFDGVTFNTGASGTLNLTLGTALATAGVVVNGYFG